MIKENNYIQLPPLRRDTDLKVVMALWEYVKMPEESRQKVLAFLNESEKNNPGSVKTFKQVPIPLRWVPPTVNIRGSEAIISSTVSTFTSGLV